MALPRDAAGRSALHEALMAWFQREARDLPWRDPDRRADTYAVLVSEVMLQQTRVETVLRYYEPWLDRWPTAADLAEATEDEVLEQWKGLGYYGRARRLWRAARVVQDEHDGSFPTTAKGLRALPGVGPYTAAAVASLIHGEPVPAVDGNIARVVARLAGRAVDISEARERTRLGQHLTPLLEDADHAGLTNEALIELGATVCKPISPACTSCPVRTWCSAHEEGRVDEVPAPTKRKPIPEVPVLACHITDDQGRVLLRRRPGEGLLGGMWGLPMEEVEDDGADHALELAGLRLEADPSVEPVGHVRHTFTHKRWLVQVRSARLVGPGPDRGGAWVWRHPTDRDGLAISTLDRKVLDALTTQTKGP